MASQAEREAARRREVERAWVDLPPVREWHVAEPEERPGVVPARIVAAAKALGWEVLEMARDDWHPPTWVSDPNGGPAQYQAKPRRQYHLHAYAPASRKVLKRAARVTGREVASLNVLWIDGAKRVARVGTAYSSTWMPTTLTITQLPKYLTENGTDIR